MDGQRFYEFIYYFVTLDSNYIDVQDLYLEFVFPFVFSLTMIITVFILAIYYNLINNLTSRFGYLKYWLVFACLASVINFVIAVSQVGSEIYTDIDIQSDAWVFGFNNIIVTLFIYFLASMVLKWKKITIHGDCIPFKTPW